MPSLPVTYLHVSPHNLSRWHVPLQVGFGTSIAVPESELDTQLSRRAGPHPCRARSLNFRSAAAEHHSPGSYWLLRGYFDRQLWLLRMQPMPVEENSDAAAAGWNRDQCK